MWAMTSDEALTGRKARPARADHRAKDRYAFDPGGI